jgi:hypothetical protein
MTWKAPHLARSNAGREWGLQLPGPSTSKSGLGPSAITSAGDGDGEELIGERGARVLAERSAAGRAPYLRREEI